MAFLRAVAKHFETPISEVQVPSRWGVSALEVPTASEWRRISLSDE